MLSYVDKMQTKQRRSGDWSKNAENEKMIDWSKAQHFPCFPSLAALLDLIAAETWRGQFLCQCFEVSSVNDFLLGGTKLILKSVASWRSVYLQRNLRKELKPRKCAGFSWKEVALPRQTITAVKCLGWSALLFSILTIKLGLMRDSSISADIGTCFIDTLGQQFRVSLFEKWDGSCGYGHKPWNIEHTTTEIVGERQHEY